MKKDSRTNKNLKGGASMKMMMFISEEKRGSKKAAMRKQVSKERKYKTNCLSYLDYLD